MSDLGVPRQEQARALGDPTRYEIYRYINAAGRDVDVPELTAHLGVNHNAVRQHLAKLVAAGLVLEDRERRNRPGRPRLVYRLVETGAPAEDGYELLATWLTETVATGDPPVEVGRRAGARTAAPLEASPAGPFERMRMAMAVHGFAPTLRRRAGTTELVLGRCPYAAAVLADPETICSLHLGLAEGVAGRFGDVQVDELLPHDPRRAGCRLLLSEPDEA